MKWEHMYVEFNNRNEDVCTVLGNKNYWVQGTRSYLITKLDEFGAEGWEVVTSINNGSLILKRQIN